MVIILTQNTFREEFDHWNSPFAHRHQSSLDKLHKQRGLVRNLSVVASHFELAWFITANFNQQQEDCQSKEQQRQRTTTQSSTRPRWDGKLGYSSPLKEGGQGSGGEGRVGDQREPNLTNIFYSFLSLYHLFVVRSSLLLSRVLLTIIFFVYKRKF